MSAIPTGRAGLAGRDAEARKRLLAGVEGPHLRAADPMLASLWAGDLAMRRCRAVGGPRRPGSSLDDRLSSSGVVLSEDDCRLAALTAVAVESVDDPVVRDVLRLASETLGRKPRYTVRQIADIVGLTLGTCHRRLHSGLDQVHESLTILVTLEEAEQAA